MGFDSSQSIRKAYPEVWISGTATLTYFAGHELVGGCPPDMGCALREQEKKKINRLVDCSPRMVETVSWELVSMSASPVAALTTIKEANDDGFPGDCSSCTAWMSQALSLRRVWGSRLAVRLSVGF